MGMLYNSVFLQHDKIPRQLEQNGTVVAKAMGMAVDSLQQAITPSPAQVILGDASVMLSKAWLEWDSVVQLL